LWSSRMKEDNPSTFTVGGYSLVNATGTLEQLSELGMLTLDDIKVSMNMEEAPAEVSQGRNMVVMGGAGFFNPKSLQTYWAHMNVTGANITDVKFWGTSPEKCSGGVDCTNYDSEADMDMQLITGVAPGVETVLTMISAKGYNVRHYGDSWGTFSPLLGLGLMAILYATNALPEECLPTVMSASFNFVNGDYVDRLRAEIEAQQAGGAEPISPISDQFLIGLNGKISPSAERILNTQLALLGLRGVTFVSSTGDGGSHYHHDPLGYSGDVITGLYTGEVPLPDSQVQAINSAMAVLQMPLYPSESPYVLGVGGIMQGPAGINDPVYWNSEVSTEGVTYNQAGGAGFSFTQPRPGYQEQAVAEYVGNHVAAPSSSEFIFSSSGRAYADVSAWAYDIAIVIGSSFKRGGGTSASAPIVAGLISQLNHHRMSAGLPTLGFVNPWLYQLNGTGFLDITSGSSRTYDSLRGFNGTPGWDVLTGWGLPSYRVLVVDLGS
jgi:subtilase family serine protease